MAVKIKSPISKGVARVPVFAGKRLKGTGAAMAFTVLTGIIAAVIGFVRPAFSRVFLDYLLTGRNTEWVKPFLLLLAGFNVIQIVMSAMQAVYARRITGKMAAAGNAAYMWKILRLPMRFFSRRMAGDIQERQEANADIANNLINTFAPFVPDSAMMVFYLVIMLRYSVLLTFAYVKVLQNKAFDALREAFGQ